ncbi:MAG: hypothetical protein AAF515_16490 [Pseudomonadota bacterium]
MKHVALIVAASLLAATLTPTKAFAGPEDEPNGGEMLVDAAIARPIGAVTTAIGVVAFVATLPFSALGGNVDAAADKLVIDPARETFVRCLGCDRAGRPERFRGKEDEIR